MIDSFSELESFDQSFKPSEGGVKPGLESLPDGEYDFQVLKHELTRTKKTNDLILRQELKVVAAGPMTGQQVGKEIERAYFFKTQQNVDILGGDLCRLGIDADKWDANTGRPLSKELPQALPRLSGIKFRGRKVTTPNAQDPAKPYHNLYIQSILSGGSSAPPIAPSPPGAGDDIPF